MLVLFGWTLVGEDVVIHTHLTGSVGVFGGLLVSALAGSPAIAATSIYSKRSIPRWSPCNGLESYSP